MVRLMLNQHLRREVSGWIDGASCVVRKTDVDGGQSEADEGRNEPRGHVHVALVGDGQDYDEEAGRGEGLVHDQRGRGRARVGERGEDAGALHVLAQRGGGVADAVGVDTVEHGRAQQGAEVLGEPVDGDLPSNFGFVKSLRFRIDTQDLKKKCMHTRVVSKEQGNPLQCTGTLHTYHYGKCFRVLTRNWSLLYKYARTCMNMRLHLFFYENAIDLQPAALLDDGQGQRDGRVQMSAGDVAADEDTDHEARP